jgi:hypothetical protein
MVLPEHFWDLDAYNCRGGVEFGILSTTLSKQVALDFCNKSGSAVRTIFEIEIGQVGTILHMFDILRILIIFFAHTRRLVNIRP